MDEDHLPISNQAHQSVFRNKVNRLLQRVLELCHFVTADSGVNHKQENGLHVNILRVLRGQNVLDSGEVRHQLSRKLSFSDVSCVVLRE